MSSKYGRRSRIQPTPKFCYHKGPFKPALNPCPGGPSIGSRIQIVVKLLIPNPSGERGYLYSGYADKTSGMLIWIGRLRAQSGGSLDAVFSFDCDTKAWRWMLTSAASQFPQAITWQSDWLLYTGGKNLDTGWVPCLQPGQAISQTAILRAYL